MPLHEGDRQWSPSSFNFSGQPVTKWHLVPKGVPLGDPPIWSPQLSNRHKSFSLPLGPPVLWHPFLHNTKCGTPIHGGYRSLGERDGHMAPPSFHRPTHFFFLKNGLGPVHGTRPLGLLSCGIQCCDCFGGTHGNIVWSSFSHTKFLKICSMGAQNPMH